MVKKRGMFSDIDKVSQEELVNDIRKQVDEMGGLEKVDPRIRGIASNMLNNKLIIGKNGDWMDVFRQLMAFVNGKDAESQATSGHYLVGDQAFRWQKAKTTEGGSLPVRGK